MSDGFGLKLEGDFDATSAYELIYAIKKLPRAGFITSQLGGGNDQNTIYSIFEHLYC